MSVETRILEIQVSILYGKQSGGCIGRVLRIGMTRNPSQDVLKREPSGTRTTQYKASRILRDKKRTYLRFKPDALVQRRVRDLSLRLYCSPRIDTRLVRVRDW